MPADRQEPYRRRLAAAMLAALALHLGLLLIPVRIFLGGAVGSLGESRNEGQALIGMAIALPAAGGPAASPTAAADEAEAAPETPDEAVLAPENDPVDVEVDATAQTRPVTTSRLASEASELARGEGALPTAAAGSGHGAGEGTSADGQQAGAAFGGEPVEIELVPRLLVHPPVTLEAVRKHKIDDYVLLRALVDLDGSVAEVQVLHGIPECPQCVAEAVKAAHKTRFDPPFVDGLPRRAWTTWSYRFGLR